VSSRVFESKSERLMRLGKIASESIAPERTVPPSRSRSFSRKLFMVFKGMPCSLVEIREFDATGKIRFATCIRRIPRSQRWKSWLVLSRNDRLLECTRLTTFNHTVLSIVWHDLFARGENQRGTIARRARHPFGLPSV